MDELLELATPEIYRHNLFRVLNLSVNATVRDVQRQESRRRMQLRLGLASANGQVGPLPLDTPLGEEDFGVAIDRLQRPVDRLLDELFWFWPGDSQADPALEALAHGKVGDATAYWMQKTGQNGQATVAAHNLAVLCHVMALDYERRLASGKPSEAALIHLTTIWKSVFARWRAVHEDDGFWATVRERARAHDDAKLTAAFIRRVQVGLPAALLRINASLAVRAAERADAETAQRQIRIMRESGFGEALADDVIRDTLDPVRSRIKTTVDGARSQWKATAHRGNQHVRSLHGTSKSLLTVVDAILPRDNILRTGLHDMVAEAMLEGQIAFTNKTNDWPEGIKLLELAKEIAASESVLTKLSENVEILRNNADSANDWCSPGYWDLPAGTIAELEAAREKTKSGDYDGAIRALNSLATEIGPPLRRCMGYSLSLDSIRTFNAAMSEYNSQTSIRKKLIENIKNTPSLLLRRPNPHAPSYLNPSCPCCGSSHYTSWVNFTFLDIPMFMCSNCNRKDDEELEERKVTLRTQIRTSLEYLLLADEVDPGESGIQRNLQTLKKAAQEFGCPIPRTASLKKKLDDRADKREGTPQAFEESPKDKVCHFCAARAADQACELSVPMHGETRTVERLFGRGMAYRYGHVTVPRCRRCRDGHEEAGRRLQQWSDARAAQADKIGKLGGISSWLARKAWPAGIALAVIVGGAAFAVDLSALVAFTARFGIADKSLIAAFLPPAIGLIAGLLLAVGLKLMALPRRWKTMAARAAAMADFEKQNPEPTLAPGIRSEDDYPEFGTIQALRKKGWGFGSGPPADGAAISKSPTDVQGLVSPQGLRAARRHPEAKTDGGVAAPVPRAKHPDAGAMPSAATAPPLAGPRPRAAEPNEPADQPPAGVTIFKSGVVDGMPYTLYSDGSIKAVLAGETLRFASIKELRMHLDRKR